MKIECMSLGMLQSNRYKTPKGNEYMFHKGNPTDVPDKEDAEFFLKAGKGELFKKIGVVEQLKRAVEPEEKEPEKLTEEQLYRMNRMEQRKLIKELEGPTASIPPKEKDRVKLLLELQEKSASKKE